MNRRYPTLLVMGLALMALLACSQQGDDIINVEADDQEMAAAISGARASLPEFWEVFDKREHGESDFCLKVRIADDGEVEHFWAADIDRRDGKVMGTINNNPDIVDSVKFGDRIEIPEADITDWLYKRDDKIVGNRTLRALFKHMSAEEVEEAKATLADP